MFSILTGLRNTLNIHSQPYFYYKLYITSQTKPNPFFQNFMNMHRTLTFPTDNQGGGGLIVGGNPIARIQSFEGRARVLSGIVGGLYAGGPTVAGIGG